MRKLIITGMALAMLAIPSVASADVQRCAAPVTDTATATFTVTQLRGEGGLWYHDYTVTVKPDGTFSGTGDVYGSTDGGTTRVDGFTEDINGKITTVDGKSTVSFTSGRVPFNVVNSYSVTDAPMDGATEVPGTTDVNPGWSISLTVGVPHMSAVTTTDMNHGEYVSSVGGGKVAAQKCAGMPLKSTQGK